MRALLLLGLLGATAAVPASAQSAQEVMERVYDQSRIHKNQQTDVEMLIFAQTGDSKSRTRRFRTKFRVFKDRSKSLVRLYSPPAQKGIGLLSESRNSEDRADQWIYLPAFRSIRKVNSQNRNDSFLGSDLTIADMAGREPGQDVHRIAAQDDEYWIIESRPKDDEDLYSRFRSKIHKKALIAVEIEFFDRDGDLLKTLTNERIGQFKGMYLALETRVDNSQTGGHTEITRSKVDIRSRIGSNEVGLRGLENPE